MLTGIVFREESDSGHPGSDFGNFRTVVFLDPFSGARFLKTDPAQTLKFGADFLFSWVISEMAQTLT